MRPCQHSNIYKFVDLIQGYEKAERAKRIQIQFGGGAPPRKRVYREYDNRLWRVEIAADWSQDTSLVPRCSWTPSETWLTESDLERWTLEC